MATSTNLMVLYSDNGEEVLSLNIIKDSYNSISKQADATIKIMWHGLLLNDEAIIDFINLKSFRQDLLCMYNNKKDDIRFDVSFEQLFTIQIHASKTGTLTNIIAYESLDRSYSLKIEYSSDLTFLPPLISAIETILGAYHHKE